MPMERERRKPKNGNRYRVLDLSDAVVPFEAVLLTEGAESGLLSGLVTCSRCGSRLRYERSGDQAHWTYRCKNGRDGGDRTCPDIETAADLLEREVMSEVSRLIAEPRMRELLLDEAARVLERTVEPVAPMVRQALPDFPTLWEHLSTDERHRLLSLLLEKVTVNHGGDGTSVTIAGALLPEITLHIAP